MPSSLLVFSVGRVVFKTWLWQVTRRGFRLLEPLLMELERSFVEGQEPPIPKQLLDCPFCDPGCYDHAIEWLLQGRYFLAPRLPRVSQAPGRGMTYERNPSPPLLCPNDRGLSSAMQYQRISFPPTEGTLPTRETRLGLSAYSKWFVHFRYGGSTALLWLHVALSDGHVVGVLGLLAAVVGLFVFLCWGKCAPAVPKRPFAWGATAPKSD